jgi:hypothetical protein
MARAAPVEYILFFRGIFFLSIFGSLESKSEAVLGRASSIKRVELAVLKRDALDRRQLGHISAVCCEV